MEGGRLRCDVINTLDISKSLFYAHACALSNNTMAARYTLVRACVNKMITTPTGIIRHIRSGLGPAGTMPFTVQEKVVNYSSTIASGSLSGSRWDLVESDYHDECSCVHLADIMKHLDMPVWTASRSVYLLLDEYETCSLYSLSQEIKASIVSFRFGKL